MRKLCKLGLLLFSLTISCSSFSDSLIFKPGRYNGAIQEFQDFEKKQLKYDVIPVEFSITTNNSLIFIKRDQKIIMLWKNGEWVWQYDKDKDTTAIPHRYGELIIIDYTAFENGIAVGGARFYVAPTSLN